MQIQLADTGEAANYTAFRDIRTQAPEKPISEYYDPQSCEQAGAKGWWHRLVFVEHAIAAWSLPNQPTKLPPT